MSSKFGTYRLCEQWVERNLQTESQIPGPSEWLGMRSGNLSWRNARRHKFAWRGSYFKQSIVWMQKSKTCHTNNLYYTEQQIKNLANRSKFMKISQDKIPVILIVTYFLYFWWCYWSYFEICSLYTELWNENSHFSAPIASYRKIPKYSDNWNICCNPPKVRTKWLYHNVMRPQDADGMANSVDPEQTIWSGSTLFAQTCLSENLRPLR